MWLGKLSELTYYPIAWLNYGFTWVNLYWRWTDSFLLFDREAETRSRWGSLHTNLSTLFTPRNLLLGSLLTDLWPHPVHTLTDEQWNRRTNTGERTANHRAREREGERESFFFSFSVEWQQMDSFVYYIFVPSSLFLFFTFFSLLSPLHLSLPLFTTLAHTVRRTPFELWRELTSRVSVNDEIDPLVK